MVSMPFLLCFNFTQTEKVRGSERAEPPWLTRLYLHLSQNDHLATCLMVTLATWLVLSQLKWALGQHRGPVILHCVLASPAGPQQVHSDTYIVLNLQGSPGLAVWHMPFPPTRIPKGRCYCKLHSQLRTQVLRQGKWHAQGHTALSRWGQSSRPESSFLCSPSNPALEGCCSGVEDPCGSQNSTCGVEIGCCWLHTGLRTDGS